MRDSCRDLKWRWHTFDGRGGALYQCLAGALKRQSSTFSTAEVVLEDTVCHVRNRKETPAACQSVFQSTEESGVPREGWQRRFICCQTRTGSHSVGLTGVDAGDYFRGPAGQKHRTAHGWDGDICRPRRQQHTQREAMSVPRWVNAILGLGCSLLYLSFWYTDIQTSIRWTRLLLRCCLDVGKTLRLSVTHTDAVAVVSLKYYLCCIINFCAASNLKFTTLLSHYRTKMSYYSPKTHFF